MKKQILLGLIGTALLAGCSMANTKASSNEGNQPAISSEVAEGTILYTGTVKENSDWLLIENLNPVTEKDVPVFDEVVLLMNEDIPLTDHKTGEAIALTNLAIGDVVHVTLVEHTPTTMSLPPQIPGMGIVKVAVEQK